jgi:hypothetical protein
VRHDCPPNVSPGTNSPVFYVKRLYHL